MARWGKRRIRLFRGLDARVFVSSDWLKDDLFPIGFSRFPEGIELPFIALGENFLSSMGISLMSSSKASLFGLSTENICVLKCFGSCFCKDEFSFVNREA